MKKSWWCEVSKLQCVENGGRGRREKVNRTSFDDV